MTIDELRELSSARLDKAYQMLRAAQIMLQFDDYATACNRLYYAVFHAMRAVLALDGIDEHSHSHLISEFRKRYLKTNILDRALSDTIGSSFQIRNESDYDDDWLISKADVIEQEQRVTEFLAAIERYASLQGVTRRDDGLE